MPPALRKHLRYPEDLFKLQSNVFSKYHVTEPRRFYTGNERWLLSPDPDEVVSDDRCAGESEPRDQRRSPEITATTASARIRTTCTSGFPVRRARAS